MEERVTVGVYCYILAELPGQYIRWHLKRSYTEDSILALPVLLRLLVKYYHFDLSEIC